MVFGRELRLPCERLFQASPNKEQSVTDNGVDQLAQALKLMMMMINIGPGEQPGWC
jgi:hypothetical protein